MSSKRLFKSDILTECVSPSTNSTVLTFTDFRQ